MAYTVFRSDNMPGTDVRAEIKSVLVKDAEGGNPIEIENGAIVKIGKSLKHDLWEAVPASASDTVAACAILGTPEVIYHDCLKHNLDDFTNEKGVPAAAYLLKAGGVFAVTVDGFVGKTAPTVDATVGLGANGKIDPAGTGLGTCRAIEKAGRYTYYVIELA